MFRVGDVSTDTGSESPLRGSVDRGRSSGQSLVELTLVLPILLFLVITIGDFGRLFAASITVESAARTAAETAAAEYLREPGANPTPPDPPTVTAAGYARVHQYAWQSVCDEASSLPNASPGSGGGECTGLPTVVCVHDGLDPDCANAYNAGSGIPGACGELAPGARPTNAQAGGSETSRYVEVRVCYRFSTFFQVNIPFIGGTLSPLGGDFYIERIRMFTVADY